MIYRLEVVEEFWPDQKPNIHVGRIEASTKLKPDVYEWSFSIPSQLWEGFRETFDGKEVKNLPYIHFSYAERSEPETRGGNNEV